MIKFLKSQASSLIASSVDFCLLLLLTETFHIYYGLSNALSAAIGAITNFLINKFWAFRKTRFQMGTEPAPGWKEQAFRYALVSLSSLGLNVSLVILATEYFHWHYSLSKIVCSLFIGMFFNFPLFKYFVFR